MGTLFGWLTFAAFSSRWPEIFTTQVWLALIIAGFAVGVWACDVTGRDMGIADHGSMVWDEIIAIWLVLLLGLTVTATYATHRTLLGRDAGVTLLAVLLTLKTLELRARRDAFVIFFLGFFSKTFKLFLGVRIWLCEPFVN